MYHQTIKNWTTTYQTGKPGKVGEFSNCGKVRGMSPKRGLIVKLGVEAGFRTPLTWKFVQI